MNTPTQHPPLTRKDIYHMSGKRFSVWQIRKHERDWGLDKARMATGTRVVLYRHAATVLILRNLGVEI